jgi:hypothetical protein
MKSMNQKPAEQQDMNMKSTSGTSAKRGDGNNEVSTGNVGTGGHDYNGASELRELRKKHGRK